jgi:hypothetical protein
MKFVQPYDQPSDPDAPYLDLNAATGVDGSIPPAKFFNNIQAEILEVITQAGITPSDADLTQLYQAILALMPSPVGGPSDASLVHYAVDAGAANALIVTPSPVTASVSTGFTILVVPNADQTGSATITVNLDPSGSVAKNIKRNDNSALVPGDIKAGRLTALTYDGTSFRIVWVQRAVVTDGVTITGDGTDASPLVGALPAGPGVNVGQFVLQTIEVRGLHDPTYAGFAVNMTATGTQIQNSTWPSVNTANLFAWVGVNGSAAGTWSGVPGAAGSMNGTMTGTWRLAGWMLYYVDYVSYNPSYALLWVRVS